MLWAALRILRVRPCSARRARASALDAAAVLRWSQSDDSVRASWCRGGPPTLCAARSENHSTTSR